MCIFLFTGDLVYKIRIYFNCGCGFESLAVRDDMTQSVIIQGTEYTLIRVVLRGVTCSL